MSDFCISVVIPVHNRVGLIHRALESIYAQTYPASEIIVVDDGSTDNILQYMAEHFPRVKVIHQANQGVSTARNTGIRQSSGDWICLLDSDDSWESNKLELQVNALSEQPGYKICHTNETWYRNGEVLSQKKKHKKKGGYIFQHCLPLCAISPSSIMLHKNLFDEVGFFDETLPACEDYDMWLRLCSLYPVLFVDAPLTNKFGGHDDQLSSKYWGMDRFRILALHKCIVSGVLSQDDHNAAVSMLLKKIDIFLKGSKKYGNNEYTTRFSSLKEQYQAQLAEYS